MRFEVRVCGLGFKVSELGTLGSLNPKPYRPQNHKVSRVLSGAIVEDGVSSVALPPNPTAVAGSGLRV